MKKKKVVIIPSRNIEVIVADNYRKIDNVLKKLSNNTEILRLHRKISGVLVERITVKEAKEKIKATGIDLTIC